MIAANQISKKIFASAAMAGIVLVSGLPANVLAQSRTRTATLSSGTVVPVSLNDSLSSNKSQQGDKFTCSIKNDGSDFYNQLPSGTVIEGYVRSVRPMQDKKAGVLDLAFSRLRYPDGRAYPITGALIGLDSKSVTRTDSGRIVAKPGHKTDRLTYVGYGAGAGLIVGLLTKSTVQDTVLGAGLGYLFGSLEKSNNSPKDVNLKVGTEMGVRLDKSLSVAAYSDSGYDSRASDRSRDDSHRPDDANRRDDNNSAQDRNDSTSTSDKRNDTASNGIGVLVGDTNVNFNPNVPPVLSNGEVLVPVRPVLEAAHVAFKVRWSTQTLTVHHNDRSIKVVGGSRIAVLNNGAERVRMEAPVTKLNGTLYVPLKFLSLATGLNATWDEASRTVLISRDR